MESSDQLTRAGSERSLIRAARELVGGSCHGVHTGVPSHVAAPPGYEFVRELHRGGQGVVYQAFQESTGRDVAIKFLRHGEVSTVTEQARLRREVQILAQLRHPSIVTIHDSGRVGGLDYFVMDYIEGRPINFFVSQAEPSQGEMAVLFMRIAEAVQSAHLRGVIHRDLKPANILVDNTGVPHVVDFGLAKLSDSSHDATMLTQDGQFIGSLFWTAPEQARGRRLAGPRCQPRLHRARSRVTGKDDQTFLRAHERHTPHDPSRSKAPCPTSAGCLESDPHEGAQP